MSRCAGKTRDQGGHSTAIYECLAKPQTVGSPLSLAELRRNFSTGLFIGFSELAGCILSWLDVVEDLGEKRVA